MLPVSTRKLTSAEREQLQRARQPPRADPISALAYWGGHLIVVLFGLGGAIGYGLTLPGLPRGPAYAAGFVLASILGITRLVGSIQAPRGFRRRQEQKLRDALANGVVEEFTVAPVEIVWSVDRLEEFGPGFVVLADESQYLYVATQEFESMSDGPEDAFPGSRLQADRLAGSRTLLRIAVEGESMRCQGNVPWDLVRPSPKAYGPSGPRDETLIPK